MKKAMVVGLTVFLFGALFLACGEDRGGYLEDGTWRPVRSIEFVAPAGVGGGSDIWMREISNIINQNNLSNSTFMPVNRGGGAGAVGYNFMLSRSGNPHYVLALHNGVLVTSHIGGWPRTYEEMIDIVAIMAFDDVFLGTRADGPFTDIHSLLNAARANPGTIRFGSDQRLNTSHFMFELLREYADADMNYVQFDSSGLVATALLGGHVDVGIFNPSEFIGQLQSGDFVAIATFAEERVPGDMFANVPTFIELGYPQIVMREWRGLAVPLGLSEPARSYYEQLMRMVMETPQFHAFLERNYLIPTFMGPEEAAAFSATEIGRVRALFEALGQ
ncbi:MAG: tripartite tricarboxylate transporter substrate-binding protein [Treponema sp.]|nr:tripartite tricarboxylate transporter substrate-binding protein [Treponema sp.]